MGSAEQYSPQEDQGKREPSGGELHPPSRPALVSPPRRPVAPVRREPAAKPAAADKPLAKAVSTPSVAAAPPPAAPAELVNRNQPITPPSEPMQYRAIGLVRGTYTPNEEEFNRGTLVADDGADIDAVLLGRVTSLVKKHLDLTEPHLWVVYPRTRRDADTQDNDLHLQIVGVWEPETLGLPGETPQEGEAAEDDAVVEGTTAEPDTAEPDGLLVPTEVDPDPNDHVLAEDASADTEAYVPDVDDNYFSIRGEVLKYSEDEHSIAVKILQGAKRSQSAPKAFRLMLEGTISGKTVGYFWDFQVKRQDKSLVLQDASVVGIVPPKKKRKGAPGRGRRPGGSGRPPHGARPQRSSTPRPKKQA